MLTSSYAQSLPENHRLMMVPHPSLAGHVPILFSLMVGTVTPPETQARRSMIINALLVAPQARKSHERYNFKGNFTWCPPR